MERREKCRRSKKSIAGAIGQTVASKASIAGAAGGCQYEIGTASAMAAAALCFAEFHALTDLSDGYIYDRAVAASLAAALALYALSWRLSVAWYGKAEQ